MFNKKNTITICANVKYAIDLERFTNQIKTYGVIEIYLKGDEIYESFVTKLTANDVAKIIEKVMYKTKTKVHGTIVFLEMEA